MVLCVIIHLTQVIRTWSSWSLSALCTLQDWILGLSEIYSRRVRWASGPAAGSDLAAAAVPWLGAAPLVASPPATVQASETWHQGAALVMLRRQLGHCCHHGMLPHVQLKHSRGWCRIGKRIQSVSSRGNTLLPATLHTSHIKPCPLVLFTVRPALVKVSGVIPSSLFLPSVWKRKEKES